MENCVCKWLVDQLDLWQFVGLGVHVAQGVDNHGDRVLSSVVNNSKQTQITWDPTMKTCMYNKYCSYG